MADTGKTPRKDGVVPEHHKLRRYVTYYCKLRAEGKAWMPKPTSKLAVYCKKHNLNVVEVISGTKQITVSAHGEPEFVSEHDQIEGLITFYQHKREEVLKNPPWLPPEDSKLRRWCQQHNIDVTQLIEGNIELDDVLVH